MSSESALFLSGDRNHVVSKASREDYSASSIGAQAHCCSIQDKISKRIIAILRAPVGGKSLSPKASGKKTDEGRGHLGCGVCL